jgi:hypothetical protein
MGWPTIRARLEEVWPVTKAGASYVHLAAPGGLNVKVELVDRWVVVMARVGSANALPARVALELNGRMVAGALFMERDALGMRRVLALEAGADEVAAAVEALTVEAARLLAATVAVACSPQPMFDMWLS